MATANTIELETCMKQCLAYCEVHPEHEFVAYHMPRLKRADEKYRRIVRESDQKFIQWRREEQQDKLAWKKLGGQARSTQRTLKRVNAVDYPTEKLHHWDEEKLVNLVERLMAFLDARRDSIDEAASLYESLERALDVARDEESDEHSAFDDYSRHASARAAVYGTISNALGNFRESMRRYLGRDHEEYKSIRWPITLMPDQTVL